MLTQPTPIETLVRQATEDVDNDGHRTIRHQGQGLQVVSRVDARGRLLRQEVTLANEVLVWQHGTRIRTGMVSSAGANDTRFDGSPSHVRLERVRTATRGYHGEDRYLRHVTRVVMLASQAGLASAEVVTDGVDKMQRRLGRLLERRKQAQRKWVLIAVGVLLVFAAAVALLRLR